MARADGWDDIYAEVGSRVARARRAAGLSQRRLADAVNVTRTSIVNVEAGRQRPPLHLLWQISTALEVEVGDLVPTRSDLAASHAPLQLDGTVVALIEQAAENDESTKRLLVDFIQQAKSKLAKS